MIVDDDRSKKRKSDELNEGGSKPRKFCHSFPPVTKEVLKMRKSLEESPTCTSESKRCPSGSRTKGRKSATLAPQRAGDVCKHRVIKIVLDKDGTIKIMPRHIISVLDEI
jgi:hypothetical protein